MIQFDSKSVGSSGEQGLGKFSQRVPGSSHRIGPSMFPLEVQPVGGQRRFAFYRLKTKGQILLAVIP
jgi:hypothetical protein